MHSNKTNSKNKNVCEYKPGWIVLINLLEPFIWMVVSCTISSTTIRQKKTKITGMTSLKELVNISGSFEDTFSTGSQCSCLRKGDDRACLVQFVTILTSVF